MRLILKIRTILDGFLRLTLRNQFVGLELTLAEN